MRILDLITQAREADPELFKGLKDRRAAKLTRAVLEQLLKELDGAPRGRLTVRGFGTFVVRNVERERDGNVMLKKRIGFRPRKAAPVQAGEKTSGKAGNDGDPTA